MRKSTKYLPQSALSTQPPHTIGIRTTARCRLHLIAVAAAVCKGVAATNGMLRVMAKSIAVETNGHKGAEDHGIEAKDPNQNEDIAARLNHLIVPPPHLVHGHDLERGKRSILGINQRRREVGGVVEEKNVVM